MITSVSHSGEFLEISSLEEGDLLWDIHRSNSWCVVVKIIGPWHDWSDNGKKIGIRCLVVTSLGNMQAASFYLTGTSAWKSAWKKFVTK